MDRVWLVLNVIFVDDGYGMWRTIIILPQKEHSTPFPPVREYSDRNQVPVAGVNELCVEGPRLFGYRVVLHPGETLSDVQCHLLLYVESFFAMNVEMSAHMLATPALFL